MTDIKLKPCPFCGGRHIETAENLDLVYCFDCGAEMHTDLVGSWNNRPIEDKLNIRIAQLEEEVIYFKKWSEYFKGRLGISGKRSVRDERNEM